jgi:nitrite transporter NirC
MPLTIPDALDGHESLAVSKAKQVKASLPKYLLSSMLAGAFVGVAIVLLLMTSAGLVTGQNPAAKLVQGGVFGVALTLVVFAGAELFTGNNMIMLQGLWARKVRLTDLVLVWVASCVGNLLGSLGFAALVNAAGIVTAGGAPGRPTAFESALGAIASGKAGLDGGQLFFRAVLCNFLVCLALWMAARATSDAAKLIVLWWALLAFIASGFEHSVANMTGLGLAALIGVGEWGDLWRNLLFTIPGNVLGGGVLVGVAYSWIGRTKAPAPAPAPAAAPMIDLSVAPNGDGSAPDTESVLVATGPDASRPA